MIEKSVPLVSVIVPVYNHELFIEQCLDSIRLDGWPCLELIIMDDGSSDKSFALAKAWVDQYGVFFQRVFLARQENLGVVKTLNSLIQRSVGEFVILLASDDYLLPGSIAARYEYLAANQDKMAVFCDALGVESDGKVVFKSIISEKYFADIERLSSDSDIAKELIFRWCVPGPVFMARREVYKDFGLYDERYFVEDRYFYLRLLSGNKLGFLNKVVAGYRIHSGSSTGSSEKRLLVGREIVRIEQGVQQYFHGWQRFYLRLVVWGNSSFVKQEFYWAYPLLLIRFFCARVLSFLFRRL